MSGATEIATLLQIEGLDPEKAEAHMKGLSEFHKNLADLHEAEAKLARTRSKLAKAGVGLWVADDLSW